MRSSKGVRRDQTERFYSRQGVFIVRNPRASVTGICTGVSE